MSHRLKKDGDITFLSLTVPDEDSVTFYIDTCVPEMGDDPAAQIPYGSDILYVDAASTPDDLQVYYDTWDMYADNTGSIEPMVTDNDYGYNYTAVWPILDENGQAIAEIQYIIDMREVRSYLNSFLYTMLGISLGIIGVAIVCYILFVRHTVTKPIGSLAKLMEKITASSNFKGQHIEIKTGDEIEELGHSFNYMLEELENYIDNLAKVTAEKERIGAIYDFVRNEVAFGYNLADDLPASQVLADGIGQCNTKGTLFMALLRAAGVPCRFHGFTIDKALQKGAITGVAYALAPRDIIHSWVEVWFDGRWVELEGFILDKRLKA